MTRISFGHDRFKFSDQQVTSPFCPEDFTLLKKGIEKWYDAMKRIPFTNYAQSVMITVPYHGIQYFMFYVIILESAGKTAMEVITNHTTIFVGMDKHIHFKFWHPNFNQSSVTTVSSPHSVLKEEVPV